MSIKRITALTVAALLLQSPSLLQSAEPLKGAEAFRVPMASKEKKVREQAFDGTFEMKGVRPDSYSLFARIDGSLGLARTDGITLKANQQRDAGGLTIEEKPHGKLLWEIGSPDGAMLTVCIAATRGGTFDSVQ